MNKYLKDLAERVSSSFAFGVLSVFGADGVLDVVHADWGLALSVGAGAAVLSLLKGLVAKQVGNSDSASLSTDV